VRVHVGRAGLVPDLIRYFEQQSDCVVLQVGETELEVSLLGSYRHDRHDLAVERLLADYWLQSGGPLEPHTTNGHN
jgi:hypothetical protein